MPATGPAVNGLASGSTGDGRGPRHARSLKILYVTNRLDVGGIETNLRLLTAELTSRGHGVAVAAGPGALSPAIQEAGAQMVPLRAHFRKPRALLADAQKIRSFASEFRPDVVHVLSASAALVVAASRRGSHRGPPVVASPMGLRLSPDEASWVVLLRAWLTTLGARRVIAVSVAIDGTLRQLPINSSRIVRGLVVGIEIPDLSSANDSRALARKQLGIGPSENLVMTVGTLKPSKSHEMFVEAASRLVEAGTDARFVIIGEGPLRSALDAEIKRRSLSERVLLAGERHPAADYLWAADVCVRPGVLEGFVGITVLEAQARAVPVVAFETEDVKAAIDDGVSGLLVPPGNVEALAGAVRHLLDDPEFAEKIGGSGRSAVEERFGLPSVVDRLEQIYLALVEPQK